MNKLYEMNLADKTLVVDSIKVLRNVDSPNVKHIEKTVNAIQQENKVFQMQQEDYWRMLSDDGIITDFEKQIIKKEYEGIQRSYTAILTQATAQNLQGTAAFLDYKASYEELTNYLYVTLKLFDAMEAPTRVDRDTFNTYFSNYYYAEKFTQLALAIGIMGNLGYRVLNSLSDLGTEGEIGLYRGTIYQYVDGGWHAVGLEGYVGAQSELPQASLNQYFLVSEDFVAVEPLIVNNETLLVNGEELYVGRLFETGFIYVYNGTYWQKVEDTTDYRYVVAMVDLVNITGQLPGVYQQAIDTAVAAVQHNLNDEIAERQGQMTIINGDIVEINQDILNLNANIADANDNISELDETVTQQGQTITQQGNTIAAQGTAISQQGSSIAAVQQALNGKISHLPVYIGPGSTAPVNALEGDFFVYSGGSYGNWYNSWIYVYLSGTWTGLDPNVAAYRNYYMMALDDILSLHNTTTGYFAQIFANAFFAHESVMDNLSVKTIYLRQNGAIQSDKTQYVAQTTGLRIDADGKIDANNDVHIGGNLIIDGQGQIGGSITITGTLNGADGVLNNVTITGSSLFKGDIESGPLILKSTNPLEEEYIFTQGDIISRSYYNIIGTYLNYSIINIYFSYRNAGSETSGTAKTISTFKITLENNQEIIFKQTRDGRDNYGYYLQGELRFKYASSITSPKTFILRDLPTDPPVTSGSIWRDGTSLKIVP